MRSLILSALLASAFAGPALAKLPPLTEEAKAKAAEAASKSAWSNKVGAYQLCRSMDRVAQHYRSKSPSAGKGMPAMAPAPASEAASATAVAGSPAMAAAPAGGGAVLVAVSTASMAASPCVDPGPYVAEATPAKPLEAAGAHSPPETAKGPPSTNATSSQIDGKTKK